jgi:diguanylate cyclase (GGDEF)-like protein
MATVRLILEAITNIRMENARISNPLTGLPGNQEIQREINRRLFDKKKFAVIYLDLDYFKWFNDQYGFQKGDQLIQHTADLIQQATVACGHPHDFVGHIGGDDFIVVSSTEDVDLLCEEIIRRYERGVMLFADDSSWTEVKDRNGNTVDTSGVSISLSLITCQSNCNITMEQISQAAALLKKEAKKHKGSVYYSKSLGMRV